MKKYIIVSILSMSFSMFSTGDEIEVITYIRSCNQGIKSGYTLLPIQQCAKSGNIEELKNHLYGQEVDFGKTEQLSLIRIAALMGHFDMVRYLLDQGAQQDFDTTGVFFAQRVEEQTKNLDYANTIPYEKHPFIRGK